MYFQKLFPTLQDFSPSTESEEDEADLRLLIQNLLNQNPSKRLTAANNALQHDFFTRRRGEVEQCMICLNTKEVSFGIRWYRLCPEVVKKHSMTIAHYFIVLKNRTHLGDLASTFVAHQVDSSNLLKS